MTTPVAPNPATNEWVPVWNLNGGIVGPPGPPGGTDEAFGTWTPFIGTSPTDPGYPGSESGQSYAPNSQQGSWYRIGRYVSLWSKIQFSNLGSLSGSTARAAWKNFPFAPSGTGTGIVQNWSGTISYYTNLNAGAHDGYTPVNCSGLMCHGFATWFHAEIFLVLPGTNPQWMQGRDLNNTSQIVLAISFFTDNKTPSNQTGYPAPVILG
jgi:hypothetical protein